MEKAEKEFRRVEAVLDGLLERDAARLRSAGLHAEDHSSRTYHYKNPHLFWSHTFMKDWLVDVDKARVTIHLHYGEPVRPEDPPRIQLTWRAELFRQGQESSIDKKGETLHALAELKQDGIAAVIMEAIGEGASWLPAAR
jgi:hypothetical protein